MLFFGFHGPTLAYTKAFLDDLRAEALRSRVFFFGQKEAEDRKPVRFSMRGTAKAALLRRMRLSQEAQMR